MEDNRPRQIRFFVQEEAPVSIAIVADLSKSMTGKIGLSREAVTGLLRAANPEDEFCLVELRDRAELTQRFGTSAESILETLGGAEAQGHTALLDGIYLAMQQMTKAHYSRKALIVISDGGDNHSRFSAREVRDLAVESDTTIYAVEPPGRRTMWSAEETSLLPDLADQTGGHDFRVENQREISDAVQRIGLELRNQYVLGYAPTGLVPDGKYHQVRVKLVPPPGRAKMSAYWRHGYYAPRD